VIDGRSNCGAGQSRRRRTSRAATTIGTTHHATSATARAPVERLLPVSTAVNPPPAVVPSPLKTSTRNVLTGFENTNAEDGVGEFERGDDAERDQIMD